MNLLSFIATIALAISIIEGLYILSRDFRSEANRLFFYICLSISIWLFGAAFGYSSLTREKAFFWLKLSSPGFIFMHSFVLHFALRFTDLIKSRWIYLLYLPSFVFLYISLSDHLVFSDITRSGSYWIMIPDYNSISFYLLMFNYLTYYFVALVLLYVKIQKTDSRRIRSQSKTIFIALLITIASYNCEPFLAPLLFDYQTYGQAPIYSIVWVSLIWYAMVKYRFLGASEYHLYLDVLNSLHEMVIIVDDEKKITTFNQALARRLGKEKQILGLDNIFVEHDLLLRQLDAAEHRPATGIILNLALSGGQTNLVRATISVIRDRFKDRVGYIIVLQGIREHYSLLKKRGITEREYELIQLIIAGNSNRDIAATLDVSVRTVETHITNIFNKLGLKNRGQIINYCSELFYSPSGERVNPS